jgi:hypothetical protein
MKAFIFHSSEDLIEIISMDQNPIHIINTVKANHYEVCREINTMRIESGIGCLVMINDNDNDNDWLVRGFQTPEELYYRGIYSESLNQIELMRMDYPYLQRTKKFGCWMI